MNPQKIRAGNFFLVVLLLNWSGCGSVTLNMSSNRFISPESGASGFESGVQGVNRVTIVPDASTVPPNVNSPYFGGTDLDAFIAINAHAWKQIDVFASCGFGGVPIIGLKLQILGDSYQQAKEGDFSMAITVGGGYIAQGSDAGFNVPVGSSAWKYSRELSAEDASLIVGYRLHHLLLAYGGPFATKYQAQGTITQSSGGATDVTNYPYGGTGLQKGVNLGVELGHTLYYKLEVAWVSGDFDNASRSKFDAGIVGGFQF
jgi:hypothetical protein